MRAAAVGLAAACVLLAGCGGDDDDGDSGDGAGPPAAPTSPATPPTAGSDEDRIKGTMTAYTRALADGNAKTACAQLTEKGQGVVARSAGVKADTCEGALDEIAELLSEADKSKLRGVEPGDIEVEVTGDAATARIKGLGPRGAKLVRSGERWLIDDYGAEQAAPQADDSKSTDVDSVTGKQVEAELKEALARRDADASFDCPEIDRLKVGQEVMCSVVLEGERGSMTVTLKPNAFLEYRIKRRNRQSYGQSQITP